MRRILGIVTVVLLAGLGLFVSYFATAAFLGARASLDGIRTSCQILQTAEAGGQMTKEQRLAVIKAFLGKNASGKGSAELVDYLQTDCSKTFVEDIWSKSRA